MKYKLLNNNKGIFLDRAYETTKDDLHITFEGVPDGATAIFSTPSAVYYRSIEEGECAISARLLVGDTKVSVALLDGSVAPKRWLCEAIRTEALELGAFLIAPSDVELPMKMAELQAENDGIRCKLLALEQKYANLENRLADLMEGYDIT